MAMLLSIILSLCLFLAVPLPHGNVVSPAETPAVIPSEAPEENSAEEQGTDSLDAEFRKGRISFARAEFPLPDPEECDIVLPEDYLLDAFGLEEIDETQVRGALAGSQILMLDYNKSADHGLGLLSVGDIMVPVAVSPGRVAVICPTDKRGVESGTIGRIYEKMYLNIMPDRPLGIGDEGVIWSGSGRYLCILNSNRIFREMRMEYGSPFIIDTVTGEMFAVDSFATKPMQEGYGFWYAGRFSEDERFFYALTGSNKYDRTYTPVRYDLETCEASLFTNGYDVNGIANMEMLKNGSFVFILDKMKAEEKQAAIILRDNGTTAKHAVRLSPENWKYNIRQFNYSAVSGWGLARCTLFANDGNYMQEFSGLMRMRPDDDPSEETDTVWMIPASEFGHAEKYDASKLDELAASDLDLLELRENHMAVLDFKLSPDGRYAVILLARQGKARLSILRLEDMAVVPAKGIELDNDASLLMRAGKGSPSLNWSEAGILCYPGVLWKPDC